MADDSVAGAPTITTTETTIGSGYSKTKNKKNNKVVIDKMQTTDIRSPKDLFIWFANDPLARWPVLFFIAGFCVGAIFVVIYLMKEKSVYVPSGVAGITICVFGSYHFKTLMALREVSIIY